MQVWKLLVSPAADAPVNMAVDEALLLTATTRPQPLLRVYAWTQPAASFGYFQKYPAHLAATHQLVRRPTGGGLVYHGADTTYTVVVPPGHPLYELSTARCYTVLHQAVAAALAKAGGARLEPGGARVEPGSARVFLSAVASAKADDPALADDRRTLDRPTPHPSQEGNCGSGLPSSGGAGGGFADSMRDETAVGSPNAVVATRRYECFANPVPGDVMAAGRKLAGGAQRRTKHGMLHQGSIAAALTAAALARGFAETLAITFAPGDLAPAEQALAAKLAREKYATAAWNKRVV